MAMIYPTGRALIASGDVESASIEAILLTNIDNAYLSTWETVDELLGSDPVEADDPSYSRQAVTGVSAVVSGGTTLIVHDPIVWPFLSVGTVLAILYAKTDGTLISIHEVGDGGAGYETVGQSYEVDGTIGWLALNSPGNIVRHDTTLDGDGSEGSPLGVVNPAAAQVVTLMAAGPVATTDGDVVVITSGTLSGGVYPIALVTPIEGDSPEVVIINALASPLRVTPNDGTLNGDAYLDLSTSALLAWDGTNWYAHIGAAA